MCSSANRFTDHGSVCNLEICNMLICFYVFWVGFNGSASICLIFFCIYIFNFKRNIQRTAEEKSCDVSNGISLKALSLIFILPANLYLKNFFLCLRTYLGKSVAIPVFHKPFKNLIGFSLSAAGCATYLKSSPSEIFLRRL